MNLTVLYRKRKTVRCPRRLKPFRAAMEHRTIFVLHHLRLWRRTGQHCLEKIWSKNMAANHDARGLHRSSLRVSAKQFWGLGCFSHASRHCRSRRFPRLLFHSHNMVLTPRSTHAHDRILLWRLGRRWLFRALGLCNWAA